MKIAKTQDGSGRKTAAALHQKTQDICLRFLHRGPYGMKDCSELCLRTEENYLEETPNRAALLVASDKMLGLVTKELRW